MLFNSPEYALFLPFVFILYWALPKKMRWIVLLVSSYYFYMSWNIKYVLLILFTTAVSFFASILIEENPSETIRRWILVSSLILCLGVLFVFKYFNFFFENLGRLFSVFAIPFRPITIKLILPVGISFYTFQTLSYVIDVYRGSIKAERHFGYYAAFVSFFPQLVAGPIERTGNLLPQIKGEVNFSYDQASYGLKLMAWGLFKKIVVADNLAVCVDNVYSNLYDVQGLALLFASVFFAIQIYCDFSGYSDIARGSAKLLGIELMENFKSPFFSSTVKELWRKWHISLSGWFRDYVYFPLGGSRRSKRRNYLNIVITFLLSGLWHGASWTYVIWGGLNGLGQVMESVFGVKPVSKTGSVKWFARCLYSFLFFAFTLVFFRSRTVSDALYLFSHMFTGITDTHMYIRNGILDLGWDKAQFIWKCLLYLVPLAIFDYASLKTDVIDWIGRRSPIIRHLSYAVLILLIAVFHFYGRATFVYFQF